MISQIAILFTGVVAIYLSQQPNENLKRYACLFGLVGQPFWMYSAYNASQFGILVLTLFYTFAWGKGLYEYWLKDKMRKIDSNGKWPLLILYYLMCAGGYIVNGLSKLLDKFNLLKRKNKLSYEHEKELKTLRKMSGVDEKPKGGSIKPVTLFEKDEDNKQLLNMFQDIEQRLDSLGSWVNKQRHNQNIKNGNYEKEYNQRVKKQKEQNDERKKLKLSYLPEFSDKHKDLTMVKKCQAFSILNDIELKSLLSGMSEEEVLEDEKKKLDVSLRKEKTISKQKRGYHL